MLVARPEWLSAIQNAEVHSKPWPHITFENFVIDVEWPTGGWLPLDHEDAKLDDGTYTRKRIPVGFDTNEYLYPFHQAVLDLLKPTNRNIAPKGWFMHDDPGYKISQHRDANKNITMIIYLSGGSDSGTVLMDGNGFEKRIPFKRFAGVAFAPMNGDSMWHRVDPISEERRSIQIIWKPSWSTSINAVSISKKRR